MKSALLTGGIIGLLLGAAVGSLAAVDVETVTGGIVGGQRVSAQGMRDALTTLVDGINRVERHSLSRRAFVRFPARESYDQNDATTERDLERAIAINKQEDDSVLHFTWVDDRSCIAGVNNACVCRWVITAFDPGLECDVRTSDIAVAGIESTARTGSAVQGRCEGVPRGRATFRIRAFRSHDTCDVVTGDGGSPGWLEVVEVGP